MARRRHFAPDQDLVHVSFKCVGDAFLMRPDAYASYVVAMAGGRREVRRAHPRTLFLSNHAHLLLGIQGCRLDSFMQYVRSLIALALNVHHERDGAFFKRRHRAEPILSTEAAVGIEQYVQQAVKHELVERAVVWPSPCSYAAVTEGRDRVDASWFDESSWRQAGARRDERNAFVHTSVRSPRSRTAWASPSSSSAPSAALISNMQDLEAAVARKRRDDGTGRLPKPSKYTTQDPNGVPPGRRRKNKKPQPYAHVSPMRQWRSSRENGHPAGQARGGERRRSGVRRIEPRRRSGERCNRSAGRA